MKFLALMATVLVLLPGGTVHSGASTQSTTARRAATVQPNHLEKYALALTLRQFPSISRLRSHHGIAPLQSASTATPLPSGTPSPTAGPTGTPSPTPTTGPSYPDPVTIFTRAIQTFGQIRSVRFQLINDFDNGTERLHIDAKGDATCHALAMTGSLAVSDVLEGTAQSQNLKLRFIRVKTQAWIKAKSTKNRWKKTASKNLDNFGVYIDNVLACPNSPQQSSSGSGSGSGSSSDLPPKSLVNLGPSTFQGTPVWRIQGSYLSTDSKGQQTQGTLEFLIGQTHSLLYQITYTGNDPQLGKIVQKQILTKFGEKVKIAAPKVGSTTP